MGTRLNPGAFDCYAAALADEEQFILNARDPGFGEVVRFWITMRQAMIARGEKPKDDEAMLAEAAACAVRGIAWRSDNLTVTIRDPKLAEDDPESVIFVGPRWHYEQPPNSREEYERQAIGFIQQQAARIERLDIDNASLRVALAQSETRIETLTNQDTVSRSTIARHEDTIAALRGSDEDARGMIAERDDEIIRLKSQLAASELEVDRLKRQKPGVFISTYAEAELREKIVMGLRQVAVDMMRDQIDAMVNDQFADRINGYAAELEAGPQLRAGDVVGKPETISVDLAEPPEINDHRFGHLEKHGDYAYARGLTVAPQHLPRALHQMEHEYGWRLLAIFGETDSEKIGFIFRRREAHMTPEEIDRLIVDTLTSKSSFINAMLTGNFHTGGPVWRKATPFEHLKRRVEALLERGRKTDNLNAIRLSLVAMITELGAADMADLATKGDLIINSGLEAIEEIETTYGVVAI